MPVLTGISVTVIAGDIATRQEKSSGRCIPAISGPFELFNASRLFSGLRPDAPRKFISLIASGSTLSQPFGCTGNKHPGCQRKRLVFPEEWRFSFTGSLFARS